jgi:hypothetical protein
VLHRGHGTDLNPLWTGIDIVARKPTESQALEVVAYELEKRGLR